jgi:3-deoxy-D-manno-octulosonic-acid transferase
MTPLGSAWRARSYGTGCCAWRCRCTARLWWRGPREPLYRRAWGERLGLFGRARRPARCGCMRCRWARPARPQPWSTRCAELRARRAPAAHPRHRHRPAGRAGAAAAGDAGLAALRHAGRGAALPAAPPAGVGVLMETEIWPACCVKRGRACRWCWPMPACRRAAWPRAPRWRPLLHPAARPPDPGAGADRADDAQRLRDAGAAGAWSAAT